MTLFEHLKEFQVRLFRAILGVLVGCVVAYRFYDQIFAIVVRPFDLVVAEAKAAGQTITLAVSGVTDAFTLQLEVVLVSGVVLSLPIWLYQLWRFLAPGMKSNERRWAIVFAAVATPLFLFGAWVAYQTMPNLLHLLLERQRRLVESRKSRRIVDLAAAHHDERPVPLGIEAARQRHGQGPATCNDRDPVVRRQRYETGDGFRPRHPGRRRRRCAVGAQ